MAELRTLIEHEMDRAGVPSYSFGDLAKRRERRRRNQRARAAVVATAIAVIVLGGLLRAIQGGRSSQPATRTITSADVGQLHRIWTGGFGQSMGAPTIADGMIFTGSGGGNEKIASFGTLFAFPAECASAQTSCSPIWTGSVGPWVSQPTVADGLVFTVEVNNPGSTGKLFAFDESCGTGGARCTPIWRADVGGVGAPWVEPVVRDGLVYAATRGGGFSVFPESCGSAGATCEPLWTGTTRGSVSSITASADTLYVGTSGGEAALQAFSLACPRSSCGPVWRRPMDAAVFGITASADRLYVGTQAGYQGRGPGLQVFSTTDCAASRGRCSPLWVAKRSGDVVLATESGGQVYVQDFDALSAYPADCRSDGGVCPPIWTYHIASGFTQAIMPVAEGDLVFTAARDGLVLAFPTDCSDPCKPIWTGTAGMGTLGGIAVSGGKVYASSDEGLVVFGLPNHS